MRHRGQPAAQGALKNSTKLGCDVGTAEPSGSFMIERTFALLGFAARLLPAAAVGLVALSTASHARPELGLWYDDSGDGAVEIYICNDDPNRLCGRIAWLKEPLAADGTPKHDRYNPKPELQNRPICGLPVIGNLGLMRDGTFDGGWIYDPKAGKSYSVAMQLAAPDELVITGYLGVKMMGKSFTWRRAGPEVQVCGG